MSVSFIYFDLGNVLLKFSHERGARQIAEVSGCDIEKVRSATYAGLQAKYESGQLDSRGFYEAFCEATDCRPDFEEFRQAESEIFDTNPSILPVVSQLESAGYRLGVLSNTCESHWQHITAGRWGLLPDAFEQIVLSYEVGAMKPDERMFQAAIEAAGVPASEIFYTDDREENVAAAREADIDAVLYTDTPSLIRDLRRRDVQCNL